MKKTVCSLLMAGGHQAALRATRSRVLAELGELVQLEQLAQLEQLVQLAELAEFLI
jgi:hypothetical protein